MVWTLGNGESRHSINIEKLSGPKIGCNAVYRDYDVEHLICVDKRMVLEAIDSNYHNSHKIYTRLDWYPSLPKRHIRLVPDLPYVGSERWDDPWHWGAGPYAVLLGAKLDTEVNILGFDLFSKDGKVNNVYKDTKNYSLSYKRAVDPRYWIYQIGKVFECFPKVNFTIYNEDDWQCPKAWNYPNVKVDTISNIYYNT